MSTSGAGRFPVIALDEVASTNSEAMRRAGAGEFGPLWITARRQTAGRGRSGRAWASAEGNLAATLLISPECEVTALHQLSLVTGVALHDAIAAAGASSAATGELRLKWPNDVLVRGEKLAGILIESTAAATWPVAAIGIGVNVVHAPQIAGRQTTSLEALGISIKADELLIALDDEMQRALGLWQGGARFDLIREAWMQRCGPLGQPIEVNTGAEAVCGAFAGIDETGALLVDSVRPHSEKRRRFTFGDVSVLPHAGEGFS